MTQNLMKNRKELVCFPSIDLENGRSMHGGSRILDLRSDVRFVQWLLVRVEKIMLRYNQKLLVFEVLRLFLSKEKASVT